jgi:thiaminase
MRPEGAVTVDSSASWSADARVACDALYREIFALPFVRGVADGTLPREVFARYLVQDALYLAAYSHAMQCLAGRLSADPDRDLFARFAADGVAAERAMQERWLADAGGVGGTALPTPACRRSMEHVRMAESAPVPVAMAAVLPCFSVYAEVGARLAAGLAAGHPYREWIAEYSGAGFADDARAVAACCDAAARRNPELRPAMLAAYRAGVEAERDFWGAGFLEFQGGSNPL